MLSATSIVLPLVVSAQTVANNPATSSPTSQFASDGIFGCNQTGAAASSVGAFSASGAYVPVSDAAVELNTGYLVYLACSLRPLVSALSQSATAGLVKKVLTAFNTGSNGNPQFSVNIDKEDLAVADTRVVNDIQGGILQTLNPAFQNTVQTAVVRSYQSATRQRNAVLTCPYSGNLQSLLDGQVFSWEGLQALENPACNPLGAYQLASELVNGDVANAVQDNMTQLQWGRGVYPVTTTDANGNVSVVTPGAVVLSQADQALQSGLLKTENASDIGQMVGALFAGIGAEAVSSAQGLAGITQASGGQASYIDQVAAAASQGVRTSAVNVAISVINGVLTTVQNYQKSLTTIAGTLTQTINSLRGAETQCWDTIIQNVCVSTSTTMVHGALTCQDSLGESLKIATSSAFSNAVINAQIATLARSTSANIQTVQATFNAVSRLAASVSNTNSQDAQSLALHQLDQLTASNSFPKQIDVQATQQQASSIASTMQILINQTIQNWQGVDSNGSQTLGWDGSVIANTVGWCDYNNQGTLRAWETLWRQ
jgi:hypothetical protein